MKFTRIAREAEEFDRALRGGSSDDAYASELALTAALSSRDVRPDTGFSADLRASLLQAAREGALAPGPPIHPSRRKKRRWTIAAPAAAVALATGGVAFAVTGLQTSPHTPLSASPSTAASELSTVHAQLADVTEKIRTGKPSAASLTSLRAQALQLRDMLVAAYGSGRNPQAIRELHDFAVSAISELAALHTQIPTSLAPLYAETLQTLVDIATTAESACPTCGLPPLQVPSSVAPLVHVPTTVQPSSGSGSPTPQGSSTPPVPVITPPASVPATPTPTPSTTGLPTVPPLPTPSVPLPTVLPTLPF
ncbi:hypothetical protein Back2_21100 [Nocardioides baekrokdamisoli]|uniref:Uncharacterized protein n=1 Tax=Nocardioides baekrokdamisoli TaxID=1804624 RepID=A0A3G9IZJ6_9ACTN|nr:hypothetical protein [Nocardioides baekrokdamisoli]BBH17823.1 hypothetical protein Back2_21100 [Nocardioides baekrokdamisoli]